MSVLVQVCAWCGRRKSVGSGSEPTRVSHGICAACALEFGGDPVDDLSDLAPEAFDGLPWGTLQLDDQAVVRVYNSAEARLARRFPPDVLGRNFFRDVAPCTSVQEFEGNFREMVGLERASRKEFEFLFRFDHGPVRVKIAMVRDPSTARTTVMVCPLDPVD